MVRKSEKEFYRDEFRELACQYDGDVLLWGEDLADKQLVIYTGKIKELSDYALYSRRLVNCGLIVINPQKGKVLRCIAGRFDPERKKIYLKDDIFNAVWIYLKKSVVLGIQREKQMKHYCAAEKPEEIVCLTNLARQNSKPYLKNDRILYRAQEKSAEEIRLMGVRQSAIDNKKNSYFYSKQGGYVHDRSCELLKNIADDCFTGSEYAPEGMPYCTHCVRTIFVRKGCAPMSKEIPACNRFLTKYGVKTEQLIKLVGENQIHFHVRNLDEMTVTGKEDSWKILVTDTNHLELWHNNYVRTGLAERYITEGYHNQGLEKASLKSMLNYIAGYTWEKHLAGEAVKKEKEDSMENCVESSIENREVIESAADNRPASPSIKVRFFRWLKRLFHV